jgi:hypothetical protein
MNRHQTFAFSLNFWYNIKEQDVLEHPENHFGLNYREVLNYWFYVDSLSDEQSDVYTERYFNLGDSTRLDASKMAKKLASEVIDPRFVHYLEYEVLEIIAAHLYLERNIPFTFLPLIFDL